MLKTTVPNILLGNFMIGEVFLVLSDSSGMYLYLEKSDHVSLSSDLLDQTGHT